MPLAGSSREPRSVAVRQKNDKSRQTGHQGLSGARKSRASKSGNPDTSGTGLSSSVRTSTRENGFARPKPDGLENADSKKTSWPNVSNGPFVYTPGLTHGPYVYPSPVFHPPPALQENGAYSIKRFMSSLLLRLKYVLFIIERGINVFDRFVSLFMLGLATLQLYLTVLNCPVSLDITTSANPCFACDWNGLH